MSECEWPGCYNEAKFLGTYITQNVDFRGVSKAEHARIKAWKKAEKEALAAAVFPGSETWK